MKTTTESQRDMVLDHLRAHGRIDPLQALDRYGCARLAARIKELRDSGQAITTDMVEVKNRVGGTVRVAEYRLRVAGGSS